MESLRIAYESCAVGVEIALQKWSMRNVPSLQEIGGPIDGLVCVVTGPTSGIGKHTAIELARRGAHVILACRSIPRGQALKTEILSITPTATIDVMELDLSSLDSVRNFSTAFLRRNLPLHILINNAGIFSMAAPREETIDGFESHLGTNHLGHFLLSLSLIPALRAAYTVTGQPSRIVNVSSRLHLMGTIHKNDPNMLHGFYSLGAYAQSKLAQVLCSNELTKRAGGEVISVSLHPGECTTDVVRSLPGPIQKLYKRIMGALLLTAEEGARCTVYCATSPDITHSNTTTNNNNDVCWYYDSNCTLGHAHRCTRDKELGEWLWNWSVDAVQGQSVVQHVLMDGSTDNNGKESGGRGRSASKTKTTKRGSSSNGSRSKTPKKKGASSRSRSRGRRATTTAKKTI